MGMFANPLSHAGYPPGVTGTPQTQPSEVRAATLAEAAAGVLDSVYISPLTAQAATALDFASPPVLGFGSTTPRPVATTKLTASTGAAGTSGTTAALTTGSIVVNTTAVTANSLVFFTTNTLGTVTAPQAYRVSARTPGTSFTITSAAGTDTSTVNWFLIN